MKNNNLNNIDIYNTEIDSNEHVLFIKYIGIIHDYPNNVKLIMLIVLLRIAYVPQFFVL